MSKLSRLVLARDYGRDVTLLNAYNQRRLGLREVPVAAITGSVGRTDLCDPARMAALRKTGRYKGVVQALAAGVCLPPVDLYLLDGQYYIRDGHHRVTAARELGILDVDAEVIECLPDPRVPAAAWHRARATFERDTGLTGVHIRWLDGYEWLRRQIAEHAWYLGERGRAPHSFAEAAARWEREVYRPVLTEMAMSRLLERVPELTAAELYLAVCDHKWYRSERLASDIGFQAAIAEYAWVYRHPWLARLRRALPHRPMVWARCLFGSTLSLTLPA